MKNLECLFKNYINRYRLGLQLAVGFRLQMVSRVALFGAVVWGTGCTYSSNFDCPVCEGNPCTSVSENDAKIDRGEYEIPLISPSLSTHQPESECYFREDF